MAQRVVIPGFRKIETSGGGEVTGNYNDLENKPSINNVPLVGNLKTVDLKLTDSTLTEEGIPAEAKEVGIRLEKHSTSLNAVKKEAMVNLLKPTLETTTQNGVTCTNNGDGTYTLNGTNSSDINFRFIVGSVTITNEDRYKLVGCPADKSIDTTHMYLNNTDFSVVLNDVGDGDYKILPSDVYYIQIEVKGNETINNALFKPMITTNLSATYDDFVPYTGDTGKINSDVAALLKRIEALEALATKTGTDTTVTE